MVKVNTGVKITHRDGNNTGVRVNDSISDSNRVGNRLGLVKILLYNKWDKMSFISSFLKQDLNFFSECSLADTIAAVVSI